MTDKARELLRRILVHLEWTDEAGANEPLEEEIRAYLAVEEQYDALSERYIEGLGNSMKACKESFEREAERAKELITTPSDDAEEPIPKEFINALRVSLTGYFDDAEEPDALQVAYQFGYQEGKKAKPAEPEETIAKLQAENFALASGQCTEGGPWGYQGGTPYCKYAARQPITEEEIDEEIATNDDYWLTDLGCFSAGVRFAERHHGITNESDS